MLRRFLVKIIILYQKTLSPDEGLFKAKYPGGYCKYTPHCSEYCKEAILKHGVIRGLSSCTWRVLRCNPWSKGGYDPVK